MTLLEPGNRYLLYANSPQPSLPPTIQQQVLAAPIGIHQVLWDQFLFPHAAVPHRLRRDRPDVVLHTNNLVPVPKQGPRVVVIHDMTPFLLPGSFHRAHRLYQQWYFRRAALSCERIVTVSENSKRDICGILGVPGEKVVVAPLASNLANDSSAAASINLKARFGLAKPYVLYVGAIHPRKNVGRIIRAFARLKIDQGVPHQLVIAGAKRWMPTDTAVAKPIECISDDILFTGAVSDNELVALFRNCDVFVYPSLYEGFGLPVLEAMSLGAPVVTSNCSSLPEVAGDAALIVNPLDEEQIGGAIGELLENRSLAARLRERGLQRATLFSWEQHARIMLDTLDAAAIAKSKASA